MAEYIEREALMRRIKEIHCAECDSYHGVRCRACWVDDTLDYIDSEPTADVAPVVHGHWIIGVDNDDFDIKCSKCEWTDIFEVTGIAAVEGIAKAMHYCPNCGARIDGGANVWSVLEKLDAAPTVDAVEVVRCKDCKHQCKIWHADKRMKEKGYWIYSCKRNSDPFVSHTVNGYDDEYCCYGERKKGENDNGDENTL